MTEDRWLRAKILLKSNYPSYFNIRFLVIDRPDDGLYLIPGQAWSFSPPDQPPEELRVPSQPVSQDVSPVYGDRDEGAASVSRLLSHQEDIELGVVYILPELPVVPVSPHTQAKANSLCLQPPQVPFFIYYCHTNMT